ncbi:Hypothetical protein AJF4211_000170 [Avibacterium paragallinarum JF4211]|nr:Hypothetical protein AJF4211_000170 [Avibacterium paragallinarum JF4211]
MLSNFRGEKRLDFLTALFNTAFFNDKNQKEMPILH